MTKRSASTGPVKVVGEYELLEKLGQGAMGIVYKGRKKGSGELVAVKILPAQQSRNAVRVRRFEQEFRAALRLDHPNMVKVLDFGVADSEHYLVMELVDGKDLASRIKERGRLPEPEAVAILVQVAQGLQQAHQAGLVHRDVKPDNILLAPGDVAKVTDLGLVKVMDDSVNLTRTNSGLGTPNFMAPEQFGNAKHADPRCDIYSLGATLYMMLTGQVPFKASSPLHVLTRKMRGDLTPPGLLVRGLSEHVEAAIRRAMQIDPRERQADCAELIDDLTRPAEGHGEALARASRPAAHPVRAYAGRERRARVRLLSTQEGRCLPLAACKESEWTVRLQDVSTHGLALLADRRFEIGSVLLLRLPGPERDGPGCLILRVVRQEPRSQRKWLLGCALAYPLSEEDVQSLL